MRKMYIFIMVAVLTLAILSWALAQTSEPLIKKIHPDKVQELKAAGIENWQPFVNNKTKKANPVSFLKRPVAAPAQQLKDGQDVGSDDGIIQYDNGVLTALFTVWFGNAGNKFTQGDTGSALGTITLNSFSFYFMDGSFTDTAMYVQPGQVINSNSFFARASINITGLNNSGPSFSSPALNLLNQSELGTTGVFTNSFVLGFWNLNSATTLPVDGDTVPGSANAVNLADYHGWSGTSGASTTITYSMIPINFMLRARVSTANALPVELMSFDVK